MPHGWSAGVVRRLAFSRKQLLVPAVLDLNRLITDMAQMLHRMIGEHIDLIVVPHPALPPVKADPSQLHQALLNLILNARDAMPRGGQLTLEIKIWLPGRYLISA
jgi:signal transduction histidine kinase